MTGLRSFNDSTNLTIPTICLHVNRKVHVACNFNCLFENEGLLKVTGGHVHRKCGNILETVHDRIVVESLLLQNTTRT